MRDTTYNGAVQQMATEDGKQKGLRKILQERGVDTARMLKDQMVTIIKSHPDFRDQRPWLEELCKKAGHSIIFLPKFHPELNWIERYWSNAKAYARKHCDYSFDSLKVTVPIALDQVPLAAMRRYARRCFRYMDAYRLHNANSEGLTLKQVEWTVKKFKSHRRITDTFDTTQSWRNMKLLILIHKVWVITI